MITQARLKDLLHYDPDTGVFVWKVARGRKSAGAQAGTVNARTGYVYVCVGGKVMLAHRLAYFYETGEWPPAQIDHINRDKSDNRWINLRCATAAENSRNAPSRTETKGVTWHRIGQKWQAQIVVNNKRVYLGLFANKDEAHAAYCKAAQELHGAFAAVA
jgi:hypothetical protein